MENYHMTCPFESSSLTLTNQRLIYDVCRLNEVVNAFGGQLNNYFVAGNYCILYTPKVQRELPYTNYGAVSDPNNNCALSLSLYFSFCVGVECTLLWRKWLTIPSLPTGRKGQGYHNTSAYIMLQVRVAGMTCQGYRIRLSRVYQRVCQCSLCRDEQGLSESMLVLSMQG